MAALDHLGGAAAAVTSIATAGTIDLFAMRDQIVSWGTSALRRLREHVSGAGRFDRTERLVAAHSVVVVTAFVDALDETLRENGIDLDAARLTAEEQIAVITGTPLAKDYRDAVRLLVDSPMRMPSGSHPFEVFLQMLRTDYNLIAYHMLEFLQGLDAYDDGEARTLLTDAFTTLATNDLAIRRYTESYRRLAADIPEFAVWAYMTDAQATRHGLQVGLAELGRLLTSMSAGGRATDRRQELARINQAALNRPILPTTDPPKHVDLPTLAEAYVNPAYRTSTVLGGDRPATDEWWQSHTRRDDLDAFLAGHLTSVAATRVPLVVLGQPGSGKSVLTRVLAARLPESDFLCVRVELRTVPAETTIVRQIEQAIFQTLHEEVSWPDLARSAEGALPVVILDGFDELLQATGLNRADYLELVQEFQEREAELGRPLAVIVTSRIAVADRARFPMATAVVRLEPFDESQMETWLAVWNRRNAGRLAAQRLRPLTVDIVRSHAELANQPLLLLLLALYDSGTNALRKSGEELDRAELYERLFADFIDREVRKLGAGLPPEERARAVEIEWRRLSAVAIAMFNRGGEVITEAELDADVPLLLNPDEMTLATPTGVQRALTIGQLLVGRFFFIHESQATRDVGQPERGFEFLHATFGDFLAARLIVEALVELASEREGHLRRHRRGELDAGHFYALTSFATITRRGPLRDFCLRMVRNCSSDVRASCTALVKDLLSEAGYAHPTWSVAAYEPRRRRTSARHAAFTANLVWLAVALADAPVDVEQLLGAPPVNTWTEHSLLWAAQLESDDRSVLWQSMRVEWSPEPPELIVRLEDGSDVSAYRSLRNKGRDGVRFYPRHELLPDAVVPAYTDAGYSLREAAFFQATHGMRGWLELAVEYWDSISPDDGFRSDLNGGGPTLSWTNNARTLLRTALQPADSGPVAERLALLRKLMAARGNDQFSHAAWRRLREDVAVVGPQAIDDILVSSEWIVNDVRDLARVAAALRATGALADPALRLMEMLRGADRGSARLFRDTVVEECARLGVPSPFGEPDFATSGSSPVDSDADHDTDPIEGPGRTVWSYYG